MKALDLDGKEGVILVNCGRKGTGKTTLARAQVDELLIAGRDIALVQDPHAQFFGCPWRTVDEFLSADEVARVNCFRSARPAELAKLAMKLSRRGQRVVLVLDELTRACTPHRYADDKPKAGGEWEPGNLSLIVNEGRHFKIDLVGTTRRPSLIHADLPALAERVTIFSLSHRADLGWVEDHCGEEAREAVARLGEHDSYEWDPGDTTDLRDASDVESQKQEKVKEEKEAPVSPTSTPAPTSQDG